MVESAAVRDISEASVYPGAFLNGSRTSLKAHPSNHVHRIRYPQALHQNRILRLVCHSLARYVGFPSFSSQKRPHFHFTAVVRVRSREGRRNRAPPPRVRWKDGKKVNPAVAAAEEAKAAAAGGGAKA